MIFGRKRPAAYQGAEQFETAWRETAATLGGTEVVAGRSVEGRPIYRFEVGDAGRPRVLLTALIHGIEAIGSIALLRALRAMAADPQGRDVLSQLNLVILPVVNPDAHALNMDRLARGWIASRRTNARGVDLNRNFPSAGPIEGRHLFAGSSLRLSPHYRGPEPLSEPETRAVVTTVELTRPEVALGFHSFGNLLLYPWAFSRRRNVRAKAYLRLARAFTGATPGPAYALKQASQFYPTVGDLDDWLDHQHGTLAMTIEVGQLTRRLLNPLRLLNPFWWMNPTRAEETIDNLIPGLVSLLACVATRLSRRRAPTAA